MKQSMYLMFGTLCIVLLLANKCHKCVPGEDPECTDPTPPEEEYPYVTPPNDGFLENFPDGEFETGFHEEVSEGVKFDNYSNSLLRTINDLAALPPDMGGGMHLLSAKKAKDPVGGHFALNMTTRLLQFGDLRILIPGAVGTISDDFINEYLAGGAITIRKPFTQKPVSLKGYMKYAPVQGDSAAIEIELYNGNTSIGRGILIEKRTINNWLAFEVPVIYSDPSATAVTHLKLIFSSSASYDFNDLVHCTGQEGSSFTIDHIWWTF
jgi:hypothetical protein